VPYDTFGCADGFIVIAVITDNFWQNLKQVLDCPDLDKPEYDTQPGRWRDREFINHRVNEVLAGDNCANWLRRLEAQRIPCAPVNNFEQALSDPQVLLRDMVVDLKHPDGGSTRGPGNPVKLSRTGTESYSPAPRLGQHTDEVLRDCLNIDAADSAALREAGVIG